MKYVGVDVAKETHHACVTSQSNKVLTAPFSFKNTIDGYNLFLSKFKKFPKNDVVIGLESTGVYGENLIAFLSEARLSNRSDKPHRNIRDEPQANQKRENR